MEIEYYNIQYINCIVQYTMDRRRHNGLKLNKIIPNKLSKVKVPNPGKIKLSKKPVKNYNIESFYRLKAVLNAKKSEMDRFYIDKSTEEKFSQMTNALRITNQLRFDIENEYNGQHVTRAWLKFYELFVHFGLGNIGDVDNLRVFFNAELPGAGICSINHLMKTYYSNVNYSWIANSLVVGSDIDEKINALGDQYGIWANNKDNWLMDVEQQSDRKNNNGDVTSLDNILDMKARIGDNKPDVVTHDAGIDVSFVIDDLDEQTGFNTQEYKNMKIHFGCALTAFETLKLGGDFMAKQYTFFESFTINLILIYASMFEEFYICKPITSGQSNSEIYLIGKRFTGMPDDVAKVFRDRLVNWNTDPFFGEEELAKHSDALSEIERYCRMRNTEQIQYINENIQIFKESKGNVGAVKSYMRDILKVFSNNWIQLYKPRKITNSDHI